ncbi:hypothetical protein [Phytoactinopolyspora mesophila]|uniref:Nuclear transport factor 2 family protein n=1 Tax=Phytoactinopolyspora mesophila TaxID=2650750 RepID=A0A7K3LY46_9ACTN|nr:hypothetical protein [Phytoactinopolyspora mesophila]NDL55961.1 hypothetical protein [Phytoactinopolyspora mesophila]
MPRTTRLPHLAALAAVALIGLASCSEGSDEDQAIGVAEDFFAALADVDAAEACELNLGDDGQPLDEDHHSWDVCLNAVETWANSVAIPVDEELPEVTFETAEIDGETAHIPDSAPAMYGFPYAFDLRNVDGDWYINGDWYL